MAAYDVIPGGPSPEMNPGCSGPFIILDPDSSCLYVWDSFVKEYVPYCLDETFSICTVPEYPLENDTLFFTCTPSRTPQEGKAGIESILQEFYSRLCAISGAGVNVEIVEQGGDPSMWCVSVSVNIDGSGGIVENDIGGYLEIDLCGVESAVIGDISNNDLCSIKVLGQHIGPGSECLTRTLNFGELTSRFIEAGSNIEISYDPDTCSTTISSVDTTIDLEPGYGTEPGADGKSVDLAICNAVYFGAPPVGTRVLGCVAGNTVLVDYIEGGGAGDGIIVVSAGPGVDVSSASGPGPDDITYTISQDVCGLPTVTRQEVIDAPGSTVFMPLCVEGNSVKLVGGDFHELVVTTVTAGAGVDVFERENPGGSSDFLISSDLCGLPDSNLQEIIQAPAGSVYMAMCIDGTDKKLVGADIHGFVGTTITGGQGVNVIESSNPSGSNNYIIDSDLCSLVTADIQEVINAPDDSVFITLCIGGVDKKVDSSDLLDLSATTITGGEGISVIETENPNGSANYEVSSSDIGLVEYASARHTGSQSIPANSYTRVSFGDITEDGLGNQLDPNGTFTCRTLGWYVVTGMVNARTFHDGSTFSIVAYKNDGAETFFLYDTNSPKDSNDLTLPVSFQGRMVPGDTLDLRVRVEQSGIVLENGYWNISRSR